MGITYDDFQSPTSFKKLVVLLLIHAKPNVSIECKGGRTFVVSWPFFVGGLQQQEH